MSAIPGRLSLFKRSGIDYVTCHTDGKHRWKRTRVGTRTGALKKLTGFCGSCPVRQVDVRMRGKT